MLSDAIKIIQTSDATTQVQAAVVAALASQAAVVHLPSSFNQHDLESFLPNRRRQIGTMTTDSIDDFATYSKEHKAPGATVFVNAENLKALSVLNLGTPTEPGHADNKAQLSMVATAAYIALVKITNSPNKQADVAEFIEDWKDVITCADSDGQVLSQAHAIEACRTITIESARKIETRVEEFSEEGSVLDSVKASAKQKLPARIVLNASPYKGLSERKFELRVGVQTGGSVPMLMLRIIKLEDHKQQMAEELAGKLREKFTDSGVPVLIGNYCKG